MERFEEIEKYVLGKLTNKERVAFENKLTQDPSLREEKEQLEKLIIGIESKGLKDKLKGRTISDEQSTISIEKTKPKIINLSKLAIAASFIGILICSWYFLNPTSDSTQGLYAEAFAPDPGLPTPMSETDNYTFYDAMVDYKMEEYDVAIEKWNTLSGTIGADTLNYYLAMAHLSNGKLDQAETLLNSIPESSSFSELSRWYMVKVYIDQEKYSLAQELLEKIDPSIHPLYSDIKAKLSKY